MFAFHACLLAAGSVAGGQGERPEAVGDAGGGVRGERRAGRAMRERLRRLLTKSFFSKEIYGLRLQQPGSA